MLTSLRLISRLDLKGDSVIKGFQMEGLRKVGSPQELATKYVTEGIDELFLFDSVASLYKREVMYGLIGVLTSSFMVPITVSGGIKNLAQAHKIFRAGADRVGVNTGAVTNPDLISQISDMYGSQALVLSLEVKRFRDRWRVYGDAGRNDLGFYLEEYLLRVPLERVGEILLTCVDTDGTLNGFPTDLLASFRGLNQSIIISGGISSGEEIASLATENYFVKGVALGRALHENVVSVNSLKFYLKARGFEVRT
jgi:imidazole glycerol-phosphate synthase subunit HisF